MTKYKKKGILRKYNNSYLIFNDKKLTYELNEIGARIFTLCNGDENSSFDEILKKIALYYTTTEEEICEDLSAYISTLLYYEIIEKVKEERF